MARFALPFAALLWCVGCALAATHTLTCPGSPVITATSGTLVLAPNYGQADAFPWCNATIVSGTGQALQLSFSVFAINSGDQLAVYDGATYITTFSSPASAAPFCVVSTSDSLFLRIYSYYGTGTGFTATWTALASVACSPTYTSAPITAPAAGVLEDRYRGPCFAKTPGQNSFNCDRALQAPAGQRIQLHFTNYSVLAGDSLTRYVNGASSGTISTAATAPFCDFVPGNLFKLAYSTSAARLVSWSLRWQFVPGTQSVCTTETATPTLSATVTVSGSPTDPPVPTQSPTTTPTDSGTAVRRPTATATPTDTASEGPPVCSVLIAEDGTAIRRPCRKGPASQPP